VPSVGFYGSRQSWGAKRGVDLLIGLSYIIVSVCACLCFSTTLTGLLNRFIFVAYPARSFNVYTLDIIL
jgi:hypothetical protein